MKRATVHTGLKISGVHNRDIHNVTLCGLWCVNCGHLGGAIFKIMVKLQRNRNRRAGDVGWISYFGTWVMGLGFTDTDEAHK